MTYDPDDNSVTYFAPRDAIGYNQILYVLSDGNSTSIGAFSIHVVDSPAATDDLFFINSDQAFPLTYYDLLANDTSYGQFDATLTATGNVSHGVLTNDGVENIVFTPDPGFVGLQGSITRSTPGQRYRLRAYLSWSDISKEQWRRSPLTTARPLPSTRRLPYPRISFSEMITIMMVTIWILSLASVGGAQHGQVVYDPENPRWCSLPLIRVLSVPHRSRIS